MAATRISALILALLSLSQSPTHAAPPTTLPSTRPTTFPTARLNNLISSLSSDDWKERQKAMDALAALGTLAEPQLRAKLKENPDASTVTAIEALLNQIKQTGKIAPTPITLKLTGVTPAQAAAAFAREANIEFAPGTDNLWTDSPKSIDLDLEAVPMWKALLELCAKTHVAPSEIRNGQIFLTSPNDRASAPPLAASGPFLVLLSRVETNITKARDFAGPRPMNIRNNNFMNPPCRLYLFPFSEPRLKAIHWYIDSIDQCVTDTGQNLIADRAFHGGASGRIGKFSSETQLTFTVAPEGKKITSLKCTARFVIQNGTEKLEVPNILNVKNSTQTLGGFRLTIASVNKVGEGRYTYDIAIYRDAHTDAEFSFFQSLINSYECKLVDAKGNALSYNGGSASYSRDKITLNHSLSTDGAGPQKPGEPVKLEWEFPSPTDQVVVPLEFRDIDLPQ